jgi:hypothetical protein
LTGGGTFPQSTSLTNCGIAFTRPEHSKGIAMNRYFPLALVLPLLAFASISRAQEVWTYQTVGPHNVVTTAFKSPVDLTYPADGVATPIIEWQAGTRTVATPLTPGQEERRMARPQLIISLTSGTQADHLLTQGLR